MCYSVVCATTTSGMERVRTSACTQLAQHKSLDDIVAYVDLILKNEKSPIKSLYMVDFVFSYLKEHKAVASVTAEMKKSLTDMFVKNCIQTKVGLREGSGNF